MKQAAQCEMSPLPPSSQSYEWSPCVRPREPHAQTAPADVSVDSCGVGVTITRMLRKVAISESTAIRGFDFCFIQAGEAKTTRNMCGDQGRRPGFQGESPEGVYSLEFLPLSVHKEEGWSLRVVPACCYV